MSIHPFRVLPVGKSGLRINWQMNLLESPLHSDYCYVSFMVMCSCSFRFLLLGRRILKGHQFSLIYVISILQAASSCCFPFIFLLNILIISIIMFLNTIVIVIVDAVAVACRVCVREFTCSMYSFIYLFIY